MTNSRASRVDHHRRQALKRQFQHDDQCYDRFERLSSLTKKLEKARKECVDYQTLQRSTAESHRTQLLEAQRLAEEAEIKRSEADEGRKQAEASKQDLETRINVLSATCTTLIQGTGHILRDLDAFPANGSRPPASVVAQALRTRDKLHTIVPGLLKE